MSTVITCGFQGRTQTRGPSLNDVDSVRPLRPLLGWEGAPMSTELVFPTIVTTPLVPHLVLPTSYSNSFLASEYCLRG